MTHEERKQQAIREIILKYTLPDALKPQYDGMTAWELSGMILKEADRIEDEEDNKDDKYANLKPEDDIFVQDKESEDGGENFADHLEGIKRE